MSKKVIVINEEECIGCGLCANACQQGAIEMVDGKAKIVREDYCDGLGNCLPVCPVGAISFLDNDIKDVEAISFSDNDIKDNDKSNHAKLPCGCPSTLSKKIERGNACTVPTVSTPTTTSMQSELNQWPVQIKLVPTQAPYFNNANLLIAADCCAFAYGNFHNEFMKNKITIIGCPKLDSVDYTEKLTQIIKDNNIKSVKIVRMEVPCCGGLEMAVKNALINSGKMIPWQVITITTDGNLLD